MKETPASLAEQILELVLDELSVPQTPRNEADIVSAILTVINPLCNEVARLEVDQRQATDNVVPNLEEELAMYRAHSDNLATQLHELTRLATAVLRTNSEGNVPAHADALDALAAHLRNGGTGS